MKRRILVALVLAGVAGLAAGLHRAAAQGRTVTVFAAASLTNAFNALKPVYERAHPGTTLRLNYGASSTLRTQLEQGAPADVFASADGEQMEPLVKAGLAGKPSVFARNLLVVVVPQGNPAKIRRIEDLARPGLKLVTTDPAVPIGRYTHQVLENLSKIPDFGPDFAHRVNRSFVSREQNVRSVLAKVELGEADAGFVYETDARSSNRVKVIRIRKDANVIATYPVAVLSGSKARPEAEAFKALLLSSEGRGVLRRYGFR